MVGDNVQPSLAGTYRLPTIVGRAAELAELGRLLDDPRVRLLTLTGTAGVGKSRLARAALSDKTFPGCLDAKVDVGDCLDRTAAWNAVLEAASYRPLAPAYQPLGPADALAVLAARIGGGRAILLLDNCDRVVEQISAEVAWLLERCPQLVLVATSRVPFNLYRECVLCVRPLQTVFGAGDYLPGSSPGARLLLDSIDSHYRGSSALADRLVIDEIVSELGGVPLAIELAAGSIARVGPVRTLHRIEAGADLHSPSFVDVPARHRTMHGAVEWGLHGLAPELLDLMLRLSLYESMLDTEIACLAAGATEEETAAWLGELVHRSLLDHVASGPSGHGYRLFAPVRAYCRRTLSADPVRAKAIRQDHVDRLCQLAETVGPLFDQHAHRGAALAAAGKRIVDFLAALHYLIDTGQPERAVRLAAQLESAWIQHGFQAEVESVLAKALEMSDRGTLAPGVTAPLCLEVLGLWAGRSGRLRRAVALLSNAVAAYRRFDRPLDAARAAVPLAVALIATGEHAAATELLRIASRRSAELGGPWPMRIELSKALLAFPVPPVRDAKTWTTMRDEVRQLDSTARLIGLNTLARTQIGPRTADRAQSLYRENLADDDVATHVLQTIIAVEGCALAYDAAGVEYAEYTLTLMLAARRLRTAHGIPQLGPGDPAPRESEHRNAVGESKFRDIQRLAGEMSLTDVIGYARTTPTLPDPDASPLAALTNRQREIAELVATGMTNRKIASQLGISEWTVVNHVRQVMSKLDCPSRLHVALVVERYAQPGPDGASKPVTDDLTQTALPQARITVLRKG
ncbi:LuxR C-terminal-related transcriptional regulator [Nocardia sp. NPDC049149]|uniref:LuxR C-terminal-related transcriptional regulator n=1 Tax=Nocardia sp. NPDC049149 TaxID=3364315 RepID=UPI00371C766C